VAPVLGRVMTSVGQWGGTRATAACSGAPGGQLPSSIQGWWVGSCPPALPAAPHSEVFQGKPILLLLWPDKALTGS